MLCDDKLVPPTTTTITVLGPDGFAAGKKYQERSFVFDNFLFFNFDQNDLKIQF